MGLNTGGAEVVCESDLGGVITSGGGFSTYYAAPSWQTSTIANYFKTAASTGTTPTPGFNPNGRGYPDISFIGVQYSVVIAGNLYALYGTSCTAPLFGAMVSLVNSYRLNLSPPLPSVGYINQVLYSSKAVYNDITSGNNKCCASGTTPQCCLSGFTAVPGWDPTTGFGSMYFPQFASLFGVSVTYTPNSAVSVISPAAVTTIGAVIASVLAFLLI